MAGMNVGNPMRTVTEDNLDVAFSTSVLPLRGAKGWLYEGGIRVPCIVKWPGQGKEGTVSDEPIISNDFYPTILEMAGLPLMESQHADGVSIVPLLKGAPSLEREAIYWHFPHYSNHGMQPPAGAIRAGDFKFARVLREQHGPAIQPEGRYRRTVRSLEIQSGKSERTDRYAAGVAHSGRCANALIESGLH